MPFSLQNSLSNLGPFLGPVDLHTDTATIENLAVLLIVRLKVVVVRWEVLGCCEVGSVGWFVTQCGSLSQHCSDSTGYSLVLC